MKMTFQPKKRSHAKVHGFRARMSTKGGRKVLAARRAKGRKVLSAKLSSINSLKKNRDFQRVYSKRQSFANRSLVMYKMSNDRADTRIGISVSKKVGNSVVRHRVTRVIRECCRLHEKELIQGLDIVIVARPLAKEQGLMEIEEAFFHVGRKLNIFLESK